MHSFQYDLYFTPAFWRPAAMKNGPEIALVRFEDRNVCY
jgi:hypothetical protein